MSDNVIQPLPPSDGRDWDCQCARCGSSCDSDACEYCDGDGYIMDDDTEWDEIEQYRSCPECLGKPVRYRCMSLCTWCEANPVEGREDVPRGKIEWFVVREDR